MAGVDRSGTGDALVGSGGFTASLASIDFREGGTSLVGMRSADGHEMFNTWTYNRIIPKQQIEFVQSFADKDGNKVDPADIGLPAGLPQDVRNVVTFRALGDNQTEMTVTEYGYPSEQMLELSKAGLEQVLDKMADTLT
jgi:uncharacterized protein YndB with AHSA1/START domain